MSTLEESEKRLGEVCAKRGFSFRLTFSEAEGTYYGEAEGQGLGEWTEVKRLKPLSLCMDRLADRVEEKFPLVAA